MENPNHTLETQTVSINEVPSGPVHIKQDGYAISGETIKFADGFFLSSGRLDTEKEIELVSTTPEGTHFHLFSQVRGKSMFYGNDFPAIELSRGYVSLFRPRENPGGVGKIGAGETIQCFEVHFSIEQLIEWYGAGIPRQLWPMLSEEIDLGLAFPLPLLNEYFQMSQLVHSQPYQGILRKMAFEGAAMQFSAAYLSYLGDEKIRDWPSISNREEKIAFAARDLLLQDLRLPPSTSELARTMKVSTRRLNLVFSSVFGVSVFQTLARARLDHARHVILEGGVSIKEIAFATGYNHVSNFSLAFKARFGVAPTKLGGSSDGLDGR